MIRDVVLIETGVANVASMRAAFARAGSACRPARDAEDVRRAEHVVLPGVGAFAAAMARLTETGMGAAVVDRIADGRPTLCVCVGLQVLAEGSDESPGVDGLGVLTGRVRRLAAAPPDRRAGPVRVPQLGWNHVDGPAGARHLVSGHVCFANSYALEPAARPGWLAATGDHGGPFVAGIERGAVVACQFHPELSGRLGADLLRGWITEPVPC